MESGLFSILTPETETLRRKRTRKQKRDGSPVVFYPVFLCEETMNLKPGKDANIEFGQKFPSDARENWGKLFFPGESVKSFFRERRSKLLNGVIEIDPFPSETLFPDTIFNYYTS